MFSLSLQSLWENRRREKRDCYHSQSQWNKRWPRNPKIRLVDAGSVDNKLSTIETIDKLMMAEALQECLSRFPKTLTLWKQSKVKHWKLLSPVVTLLQFCQLVSEKARFVQLFCEIKLATNPNMCILVIAPQNRIMEDQISVKWGWHDYTIPMVRDICTFAVFFSVSRPFMSLHSCFWRAFRVVFLDHAMANFKRS